MKAGGARAQGDAAAPGALEKIERSGREALVEMRRLLGVLRADDDEAAARTSARHRRARRRWPTASVQPAYRSSCPSTADRSLLTPALELSVYRIVQEALTNALKHAGPAVARVDVRCTEDGVVIDVSDDGRGVEGDPPPSTGQGLVGMRERVAMFGVEHPRGPRAGRWLHRARAAAVGRRCRMISVLIADDQELAREGLRA